MRAMGTVCVEQIVEFSLRDSCSGCPVEDYIAGTQHGARYGRREHGRRGNTRTAELDRKGSVMPKSEIEVCIGESQHPVVRTWRFRRKADEQEAV